MFNLFKRKPIEIPKELEGSVKNNECCMSCKHCKENSLFNYHCTKYNFYVDGNHICNDFEWSRRELKSLLNNLKQIEYENSTKRSVNFRKIDKDYVIF